MWNVVDEMISYLNPVPGHSKPSCAQADACEIVSGYMTPHEETDTRSQSGGSVLKQVGILYADIAATTQPCGQVEDRFQTRLEEATKILMANIVNNDGRLVSVDGHAILAEFKDADQALHCAINVQMASRQWNADQPSEHQVLFRLGVTQGDMIADRKGLGEKLKYLATHLENLASVNGVCITESIRECLDDHPSLKLVAGGKQYVKNLDVPVESFWIAIDTEQFVAQGMTGAVKVRTTIS